MKDENETQKRERKYGMNLRFSDNKMKGGLE